MSVHFASQRSGAGCGSWLRYFAAALCMGGVSAQDQPLLNYWWVYEDELPAVQNDTTRVIRVIGEKAVHFFFVFFISLFANYEVLVNTTINQISYKHIKDFVLCACLAFFLLL